MPEEVVIIIVAGMVLGVPILGLTARMVIRTIAEVFGSRRQLAPDPMSQERIMRLEDEVDLLRKAVSRLEEAEEFRQALGAPKAENPALPSPSEGE